MRHKATPDFWYYYRQLPPDVQGLADRCYDLLKLDPSYPSLHFKKVGQFWSVRVGLHYRALAVEQDGDFAWFWIGSHAEYDKLLG
ncbi:ParE family toxin-like protein [Tolypothrix sp. VBCCA 56010]|uniref:ParE family toxin-like protein n=1 Tax=Tolypothrix sp. VBCCA 56010 TaxID=3137731 RepID=UPI003D7D647F